MDGMWCFVGRTVTRSVVAAGGHGGEKKEREGWLQENRAGEADFFANFELSFSLPQSMKFAPIYRDTKRVILSSMWKNSQPLIQLEESKPSVQSVHLELPNLAVQGCRLSEVATLGQ
jgi:hypothetical protein